jgi:hypothetical protein
VDALAEGPRVAGLLAAKHGLQATRVAEELASYGALLGEALGGDLRRMELVRALARRSLGG